MNWKSALYLLLTSLQPTLSHSLKRQNNAIHATQVQNATDTALYYDARINPSTYRIINHDAYVEYPFIYVKLYPELALALVVDTGVGAENGAEGTQAQELKDFIEEEILPGHEVPCKQGKRYQYLVFCTHCHFDHIGGIHAFSSAGADIIASSFNKSFVSLENRDANSLCSAFGTNLPEYQIDRFVADGQRLQYQNQDLGLTVLHTPGHTPDQLALYDERENWIFVGDTVYKRKVEMPWGKTQDVPIILVGESHWGQWVSSLRKLGEFVEGRERAREEEWRGSGVHGEEMHGEVKHGEEMHHGKKMHHGEMHHEKDMHGEEMHGEQTQWKQMRLSSGHSTSGEPAKAFVQEATAFVERIIAGDVPIIARLAGDEVAPGGTLGPETFVLWQEDGNPLFSLLAPERVMQDF